MGRIEHAAGFGLEDLHLNLQLLSGQVMRVECGERRVASGVQLTPTFASDFANRTENYDRASFCAWQLREKTPEHDATYPNAHRTMM